MPRHTPTRAPSPMKVVHICIGCFQMLSSSVVPRHVHEPEDGERCHKCHQSIGRAAVLWPVRAA